MGTKHKAYAIVLTETWLYEDILDAEVKIEGFNIFRSDRKGRNHGGVAVYLRDDISAIPSLKISIGSVEALSVKCRDLKAILHVIYRPPDSEIEGFLEVTKLMSDDLNMCQAHGRYPNAIGFGDFNFPNLQWGAGRIPPPESAKSLKGIQAHALLELMRQ